MLKKTKLKNRRALGEKHVENRRKNHNEQKRLQSFEDKGCRHSRQQHRAKDQKCRQKVRVNRLCQKQSHNDRQRQYDLNPRVQPVDHRIAGKILSERNITKHLFSPPLQ